MDVKPRYNWKIRPVPNRANISVTEGILESPSPCAWLYLHGSVLQPLLVSNVLDWAVVLIAIQYYSHACDASGWKPCITLQLEGWKPEIILMGPGLYAVTFEYYLS